MRRAVLAIASVGALSVAGSVTGCGECATTVWCSSEPVISYSGQFIERRSGQTIAGVRLSFVRDSGISLVADSVSALSDGDGFFRLRAQSVENGVVFGTLRVVPPAPYPPYTVPGIRLATSRVRGDGGWLGRMMVNPYLFVVGVVYDRKTHARLSDVNVVLRRVSGGRASEDVVAFNTDFGGQFSWEPQLVDAAPIVASFEMRASGFPRPFVVQRTMPLQYKDDDITFVLLPLGSGLSYIGTTARRATGEQAVGTTVEFTRTGGISVAPDPFVVTPDATGTFPLAIEPVGEGTLTGDLTIKPPPPYPSETHHLTLATSDDDQTQWLGFLGYGAQLYTKAYLRDTQTGTPLPAGTAVTIRRVGGTALAWPTPHESDAATVQDSGRVVYQAPTVDAGATQLEMIVHLPMPYLPDTVAVTIPSRFSDDAYIAGVLPVRRRTP